jgi:hypothetical protein
MKRIFGILLFILIANVTAFAQVDLLGTACEPYGSISIHSEPAADNLPVVAYINGVEFGRCLTLGGQYQLYIAKDNLETPEKDGWDSGDIIMIKISGNLANPSLTAAPGRSRVDLTVNTLSVRLDTWGKIKALFK